MRILFITNCLDMGGIETNVRRLTAELSGQGHTVTVAGQPGRLSQSIRDAGGRTLDLHLHPVSPLNLLHDLIRLRRLLAREVDIVHVFAAKAAVFLRIAQTTIRKSARPEVIASLMGVQSSLGEAPWKTRLRAWATLVGSNTVVVTSPAIGDLINDVNTGSRRMVTASVVGVAIPEELDCEHKASLRSSLGLGASDIVVLTIGRLNSTKSHDLFIQAASIIASRRPDVVFLVVGGGELLDQLEDLRDSVGLAGRLCFLGERDDVSDLLSIADVYVRPGVVEGFVGITVLEAQAMGVPVVSFDTRDVRPAITDSVSGLLVEAGDTGELAEAILRLVEDPTLALTIGEAGREHFKREFWLDSIVAGLSGIYESAIDRASSPRRCDSP
jgi:glycosyltransferase involved in cell wall biosynthesis